MFCSPMERHTARENAVCFAPYRERLIQRILQLYGAIHATRIVTPCSRHHTAIQRYTALYAHTAIHRYTLYSPMQHPSGSVSVWATCPGGTGQNTRRSTQEYHQSKRNTYVSLLPRKISSCTKFTSTHNDKMNDRTAPKAANKGSGMASQSDRRCR